MRKKKIQTVIVRGPAETVPRAFVTAWVATVVTELLKEKITLRAKQHLRAAHEVSLVFVSKKEIRRLNREFRGKDKSTDVLSFAPTDENSLGELVFSLDVIRAQAFEHGLSVRHELGYMILHGLLHLLGYDHEPSKAAARRMFAIQDRVFETLRIL